MRLRDSYPIPWKDLYLWGVDRIRQREIDRADPAIESALASRAQELSISPEHHEERSEMAAANAALLSIKIHKLGWPPVSARDGLR